jgi:hypothetical protein
MHLETIMKIRKIHKVAGAALTACVLAASGASFAQSVPATGGTPSASPPNLVPPMKNPVPPMPDPPQTTNTTPVPPMGTTTPVPPMGAQGMTPTVPATQQSPGAPNLTPAAPATRQPTGRNGIPSKTDNAITAFRSLDSANRGFVTRADTDRIPGFTGFDSADVDRDGHLTAEEFASAWKFYSGQ